LAALDAVCRARRTLVEVRSEVSETAFGAAAFTQLACQFDVARRDAAVGGTGLHHHWQVLETRLGEEDCETVEADLALAWRGVAVAVGAERRDRVVEVDRVQSLEADGAVALGERLVETVDSADL